MKTITLCGSVSFYPMMDEIEEQLSRLNFKVLRPPKTDDETYTDSMTTEEKAKLKQKFIDRHIEKIKACDAVLICNYEKNNITNYIGANSFLEMGFAYILGKKIFLLNELPEQSNSLEIEGMMPIELKGRIENISF